MWPFGRKNKEPFSARISRAVYAAADRIERERVLHYSSADGSPLAEELARVGAVLEQSAAILRECAELIGASLPCRDARREQELAEAWRRAEQELDRILRGMESRLLVAGDVVKRASEEMQTATHRYLTL